MELKTITKELDGLKFNITQFTARKSIKLEKRTLTYLAPMLNILDGAKSLESEIDFSKIVIAVQGVLNNLSEEEWEQYIFEMFENVSCFVKSEKQEKLLCLNDVSNFDIVFIGKNMTVYKLLLEVMSVNKFAFFELVGGSGMQLTGLFSKTNSEQKKSITL